MVSYRKILVAVLSLLCISNVSRAMEGAGDAAARIRAKAEADQRARDENWRRIQAQQAAERARAAQQQQQKK